MPASRWAGITISPACFMTVVMPVRSESGPRNDRGVEILAAPALLGCLLLAWQGTVSLSGVSAFILPPPGAVLAALLRLLAAPAVWRHVGLTALETGVGFLAATLLPAASKSWMPACAGHDGNAPLPARAMLHRSGSAPTGHHGWVSCAVPPRRSPAAS